MEIELESVGYSATAITNVMWYERIVNDATKRAVVITHYVKPTSYKREAKVNHVRFGLEEGVLYRYHRTVSLKPKTVEERWFQLVDGAIQILELPQPAEYYQHPLYCTMWTQQLDHAQPFLRGETECRPLLK